MRSRKSFSVLLLGFGIAAAPFAVFAETWRSHFDSDGPSRPPGFFDFVVLGEAYPANWMVLADRNPPSAPNQVTQTFVSRPEGSIACAVRRNVSFQDGNVQVWLKKIPSRAGLVFRMKDEKNFLLLLLDSTTDEAELTSFADGKPAVLARGKAELQLDWGSLSVHLAGRAITATWNEKKLLEGKDPKPVTGRAGFATEGAGNASFDEFVIESP
jgi:hypothetical protein